MDAGDSTARWLLARLNQRSRDNPDAGFTGDADDLRLRHGPDPFAARSSPPLPQFHSGYEQPTSPDKVAAYFAALSLTRATEPGSGELSVASLAPGSVTTESRGPVRRKWVPSDMASLWDADILAMPNVVYSVWLGSPLGPQAGSFMENVKAGATKYAGRVDFVVFTDITRETVAQARETRRRLGPAGERGVYADVNKMLAWAEGDGTYRIHLVNVDDVFNEAYPMVLEPLYRMQTNNWQWAAASDILRLEILYRFGGAYSDGDNSPNDDLLVEFARVLKRRGICLRQDRKLRVWASGVRRSRRASCGAPGHRLPSTRVHVVALRRL